jgi:hypothetical protein
MPAKKAEGQDHDAATGSWIESDDEMGSDEMGTPKIRDEMGTPKIHRDESQMKWGPKIQIFPD